MTGRIIELAPQINKALLQTFYMMFWTLGIAAVAGIPLGTLLYLIRPGSVMEKRGIYLVLDALVNIVRSFPFLILMVAIIPFTRMLIGSSLGTSAVIVPLSISAAPDFARLVEQVLIEVDRGAVEMARSVGASTFQIVVRVLYREGRSGIVGAATMISVSFLSYSTVAGLVGGGGIGDFAIRYGYYRYEPQVMIFTVALIIILVQIVQTVGRIVARALDKRI
ncbi:MAG: ABC transporter permease [Deltaproteobacteria bacterium]|jgi:D-methionine transport system permease protein|nr:ABC transporter permease [Deltaproteobacteria bacterium]